jgi:hypothetical protein
MYWGGVLVPTKELSMYMRTVPDKNDDSKYDAANICDVGIIFVPSSMSMKTILLRPSRIDERKA